MAVVIGQFRNPDTRSLARVSYKGVPGRSQFSSHSTRPLSEQLPWQDPDFIQTIRVTFFRFPILAGTLTIALDHLFYFYRFNALSSCYCSFYIKRRNIKMKSGAAFYVAVLFFGGYSEPRRWSRSLEISASMWVRNHLFSFLPAYGAHGAFLIACFVFPRLLSSCWTPYTLKLQNNPPPFFFPA